MEMLQYRMNTYNPDVKEGALYKCAYSIMGYAGRYETKEAIDRYLPVKMEVLECTRNEKRIELPDFVPLSPDEVEHERNAKDFCLNWRSILGGECSDWKLVKIYPMMTGVCLTYFGLTDKVTCNIHVNVVSQFLQFAPSIYNAKLQLKFDVPHADGRADTLYWLDVEYRAASLVVLDNRVRLERIGCDNIHREMRFQHDDRSWRDLELAQTGYFDDVIPAYADVVDYIDI